MMTKLRLGTSLTLLLGLISAFLWFETGATGQTQSDRTVLGNLISRALSTPTTRVSIGAVEGALSSDATIRNVTIADRDGVWLRLDRARLIWSRTALLSRRLEINRLEVGTLEVLRRPLSEEQPVAGTDEPLLPELPVKVQVDAFSINEFVLGEPVVGAAARLQANGAATLGNPREGLNLNFAARRLDAAGRFSVRLAFVPQGERLDVAVNLEEPESGLAARLASIPGLPPVRLDLTGSGVLDDWRSTLTFQAGPDIGASGTARLARANDARRLTLDLSAQVEGLLPAPVAPVFAGTTNLRGAVGFGDAGAVTLDEVALTSRTARLTIAGTVSQDQVLDVTAQVRALPTDGRLTRAGAAEIENLSFDARATGPYLSPHIVGRLAASNLRLPQGRFGQLQGDLDVVPEGAAADQRFRVRADARGSGIALADPALREAVGQQAEFALRAVFGTDGVGDVEILRVVSSNADLSYQGRLGSSALAGTVQAEFPRLRAFSGLAGRRLAGSLTATTVLQGDPSRRDIRAEVTARGTGLSFAQPALDGLTGGRLSLDGVFRTLPNGYAFEDLRLDGAFLTGRVNGSATEDAANVTARLSLRDLSKAHASLAGRADLDARLTGSLARPDIDATLTTDEARALGRRLRGVRAEATIRDATGMLDGTVGVSGSIGDETLDGNVHVRRGENPVWLLDAFELTVGTASINGRGTVDAANLVEGTLRIAADNLDDLSPFVLTRLGGSLNATVDLAREDGRQDVRVQATGRAVRGFDVALAGLNANLAATDVYGRPGIDGQLAAERLEAGGQTFSDIRLTAQGSPQASDLSLEARARGFALSGQARLVPGDQIRLEIARLSAERGRERLALAQPSAIVLNQSALAIVPSMVITAGAGRITLAGSLGQDLDLRVGIASLPLSIASVVDPALALTGTLNGEIRLDGPSDRPDGEYRLSIARFASRETRDAGLPPVDGNASGRVSDGRATIDARVSAGAGAQLQIGGSVPTDATGVLDLTVRGRFDAALANAMLTPGQRVTGRLDVDASIAGSFAEPAVQGSATLSGGSFIDTLQGIRIANIQGRVTGQGNAVTIERLTGTTRNGGTIAVSGRVDLDPAAGFPGALRITGSRAELVASDVVEAVVDLDLSLDGPLARTPRVAGRIGFVRMDVTIPDRLAATVQPLPNTRHIAPPPQIRARLAAVQRQQAERRRSRPFDATLELTLSAPSRIFVRGRGIDAELGGDLRLTGTSRDPVAVGAFDLRRGRFTILGQRLDFSRGRLTFTGDLAPELDFVAETRTSDITARVAISGSASEPDFDLSSDPALPQDEVLSRLLFQKASGSLSGFQALQLAQAVAQLSGGGGNDVFERTRRALGVDSLDITAGARGGPAIGASRYIGDRLSVGVRAGARPEDTGLTVGIDVTRRLKVQGEVGASGNTSIGVASEWEY
jgi:translocation and assembly module TamB